MVAISGVKLGLFADEYGSIFEEMARQFGALYVAQVLKGILTDSGLRNDQIQSKRRGLSNDCRTHCRKDQTAVTGGRWVARPERSRVRW